MRFRMFMLAVSGAAAIAAVAPPVSAQTQGEDITSTVIPLAPTRLPSEMEISRMCEFVADDPYAKQTGEWSESGLIDVNNDGIMEDVTLIHEGTMRIAMFQIKTLDGKPIPVDEVGFEWKDFWSSESQWLTYEGYTYRVNFKDRDRHLPTHVTYIRPDNSERVVCDFKNVTSLKIVAMDPAFEEICRAAQESKSAFSSAHNAPPNTVRNPELREDRDYGYLYTTFGPVSAVDFDNDGEQEILIHMNTIVDRGRGCTSEDFDLVDENRRILKNSAKRKLLEKLHGRGGYDDELSFAVESCTVEKKFILHNNKVYLEIVSKQKDSPYYALALAENGQATKVCESTRSIRNIVNP